MGAPDAPGSRRPVVVGRPRPGALAPGPLEDVVHHQHRHVAADAVALVGDRAERVDDRGRAGRARRRSAGRRPARPGSTGRGRSPARGRRRARTRPGRARGRRRRRGRSTRDARPSTDGRARRGSARSRGSGRARARPAPRAPRRAPPARRGARRPGSRGCSTASRPRPPSRSRAARAGSSRRSPSFSSAIAIPAGLRSQTPISQTASNPSSAIASHSRVGHAGERRPRSRAAAQLVEPDPGVDLVDEGMLDQLAPR